MRPVIAVEKITKLMLFQRLRVYPFGQYARSRRVSAFLNEKLCFNAGLFD